MPTKATDRIIYICHNYCLLRACMHIGSRDKQAVGETPGCQLKYKPVSPKESNGNPSECEWWYQWQNHECAPLHVDLNDLKSNHSETLTFVFINCKLLQTHLIMNRNILCSFTVGAAAAGLFSAVTPFSYLSKIFAQDSTLLHKVTINFYKKLIILMLVVFWGRFVSYLKHKIIPCKGFPTSFFLESRTHIGHFEGTI